MQIAKATNMRDNARKITLPFPMPLPGDAVYPLMLHPLGDLENTQPYCFQHEAFFDALKPM